MTQSQMLVPLAKHFPQADNYFVDEFSPGKRGFKQVKFKIKKVKKKGTAKAGDKSKSKIRMQLHNLINMPIPQLPSRDRIRELVDKNFATLDATKLEDHQIHAFLHDSTTISNSKHGRSQSQNQGLIENKQSQGVQSMSTSYRQYQQQKDIHQISSPEQNKSQVKTNSFKKAQKRLTKARKNSKGPVQIKEWNLNSVQLSSAGEQASKVAIANKETTIRQPRPEEHQYEHSPKESSERKEPSSRKSRKEEEKMPAQLVNRISDPSGFSSTLKAQQQQANEGSNIFNESQGNHELGDGIENGSVQSVNRPTEEAKISSYQIDRTPDFQIRFSHHLRLTPDEHQAILVPKRMKSDSLKEVSSGRGGMLRSAESFSNASRHRGQQLTNIISPRGSMKQDNEEEKKEVEQTLGSSSQNSLKRMKEQYLKKAVKFQNVSSDEKQKPVQSEEAGNLKKQAVAQPKEKEREAHLSPQNRKTILTEPFTDQRRSSNLLDMKNKLVDVKEGSFKRLQSNMVLNTDKWYNEEMLQRAQTNGDEIFALQPPIKKTQSRKNLSNSAFSRQGSSKMGAPTVGQIEANENHQSDKNQEDLDYNQSIQSEERRVQQSEAMDKFLMIQQTPPSVFMPSSNPLFQVNEQSSEYQTSYHDPYRPKDLISTLIDELEGEPIDFKPYNSKLDFQKLLQISVIEMQKKSVQEQPTEPFALQFEAPPISLQDIIRTEDFIPTPIRQMKKIHFQLSSHLFQKAQTLQTILMTDYMKKGIHHSYQKVTLSQHLTESQLKEIEDYSQTIRTDNVKQLKIFLQSKSLQRQQMKRKIAQKNISKSQVITSNPEPQSSKPDSNRKKQSMVLLQKPIDHPEQVTRRISSNLKPEHSVFKDFKLMEKQGEGQESNFLNTGNQRPESRRDSENMTIQLKQEEKRESSQSSSVCRCSNSSGTTSKLFQSNQSSKINMYFKMKNNSSLSSRSNNERDQLGSHQTSMVESSYFTSDQEDEGDEMVKIHKTTTRIINLKDLEQLENTPNYKRFLQPFKRKKFMALKTAEQGIKIATRVTQFSKNMRDRLKMNLIQNEHNWPDDDQIVYLCVNRMHFLNIKLNMDRELKGLKMNKFTLALTADTKKETNEKVINSLLNREKRKDQKAVIKKILGEYNLLGQTVLALEDTSTPSDKQVHADQKAIAKQNRFIEHNLQNLEFRFSYIALKMIICNTDEFYMMKYLKVQSVIADKFHKLTSYSHVNIFQHMGRKIIIHQVTTSLFRHIQGRIDMYDKMARHVQNLIKVKQDTFLHYDVGLVNNLYVYKPQKTIHTFYQDNHIRATVNIGTMIYQDNDMFIRLMQHKQYEENPQIMLKKLIYLITHVITQSFSKAISKDFIVNYLECSETIQQLATTAMKKLVNPNQMHQALKFSSTFAEVRKKRLEKKIRLNSTKKNDNDMQERLEKKTQLILDQSLMFIVFNTDKCEDYCNDFKLNSEFGYQTIFLRRGFYIQMVPKEKPREQVKIVLKPVDVLNQIQEDMNVQMTGISINLLHQYNMQKKIVIKKKKDNAQKYNYLSTENGTMIAVPKVLNPPRVLKQEEITANCIEYFNSKVRVHVEKLSLHEEASSEAGLKAQGLQSVMEEDDFNYYLNEVSPNQPMKKISKSDLIQDLHLSQQNSSVRVNELNTSELSPRSGARLSGLDLRERLLNSKAPGQSKFADLKNEELSGSSKHFSKQSKQSRKSRVSRNSRLSRLSCRSRRDSMRGGPPQGILVGIYELHSDCQIQSRPQQFMKRQHFLPEVQRLQRGEKALLASIQNLVQMTNLEVLKNSFKFPCKDSLALRAAQNKRKNSVIPLINYQPSLFDPEQKISLFKSHKTLDLVVRLKTLTAVSGIKNQLRDLNLKPRALIAHKSENNISSDSSVQGLASMSSSESQCTSEEYSFSSQSSEEESEIEVEVEKGVESLTPQQTRPKLMKKKSNSINMGVVNKMRGQTEGTDSNAFSIPLQPMKLMSKNTLTTSTKKLEKQVVVKKMSILQYEKHDVLLKSQKSLFTFTGQSSILERHLSLKKIKIKKRETMITQDRVRVFKTSSQEMLTKLLKQKPKLLAKLPTRTDSDAAQQKAIAKANQQRLVKSIVDNKPQIIQDFFSKQLHQETSIDMQDEQGFTLLTIAVIYNRSKIVEILLEAGANPNLQTFGDAKTPLQFAVQRNNKKIQDLLLNAGADETQ